MALRQMTAIKLATGLPRARACVVGIWGKVVRNVCRSVLNDRGAINLKALEKEVLVDLAEALWSLCLTNHQVLELFVN